MVRRAGNLFSNTDTLAGDQEVFDILARGVGARVERIVSRGQTTPAGEWYDQDDDEWVVLLQGHAELTFEDGTRHDLHAGDWLFIVAHARHRVSATSVEPPCVWVAVHGALADAVTG